VLVEQLAARLDEASTSDTGTGNDGVIPLQSGGTRPPLFFVHPVGGSVIPAPTAAK